MMYGNSYTGKSHLKEIVRGKGSDASSQRSGQTDFSQRVLYRDGGKCIICSETESLQGAHLIDHCLHTMVGIVKTFEDCRISGIQDTQNGLAMCIDCHSKFDNRSNGEQVFINPVTKKLEVSIELQEHPKWRPLIGKVISPQSQSGYFPNSPLFTMKYDNEQRKMRDHIEKQATLTTKCDECGKALKNAKGVKQHKLQNGCMRYIAKHPPPHTQTHTLSDTDRQTHTHTP